MVYYDRYDIVFQEIPNEVSLAFTIKGCPNNCAGCHSPHLRENNGKELSENELINILDNYKNSITTVLFLGGDSNHSNIIKLLKIVKRYNLKTAIYSGLNYINLDMLDFLDYYKVGSYSEELGGLSNKKTNQKLYLIEFGKIKEDITKLFWNK